ncbi:hypothetical protein TNCV_1843691 [Trichonephila clavipes]|nr:hypothetical protein TNCV_1843691 [Trichonephila clavipes]
MLSGPKAPRKTSHRLPGFHPYNAVSRQIPHRNLQWCTTAQHYATTPFATKSVDLCYIRGMKTMSIFSPGEDSMRITLVHFDTPPFLWCPRLMFSAPQHPIFPAGCSQMNALYWTPGVKASFYKTAVDCFPGNSSRHSRKITSKLRSRYQPM